jgi:cyclophilin family peptidyl-prolyl cis-trans isomerase
MSRIKRSTLLALGFLSFLALPSVAVPTVLAPAQDDEGEKDETEEADVPDPLVTIRAFIAEQEIDKTQPKWKTRLPKPPKLEFGKDTKVYWNLETSEGDVVIQLMPRVAPMHVSSTMYLAELGFYDDLAFHRVIPGFMAQGGCPLGTGSGSPGYKYAGELEKDVKHDRPGLLSMANAGPNTDGSQFFITFVPTPHLDGKHTIFGEVVEGMDNLKKIEAGGTTGRVTLDKATITNE